METRPSTDESSAGIGAFADAFADDLQDRLQEPGTSWQDLDAQARTFIRESPFVALAAAIAGGFLIGRLLSRR